MTDIERLALVKADLEISNSLRDNYLSMLLKVAEKEIAREGISLTESLDDEFLIIMYAAYLYRKRVGEAQGMPRMLRYLLNNRQFGKKGGGEQL